MFSKNQKKIILNNVNIIVMRMATFRPVITSVTVYSPYQRYRVQSLPALSCTVPTSVIVYSPYQRYRVQSLHSVTVYSPYYRNREQSLTSVTVTVYGP